METLELDQRALDLAAEKSPVLSEASTGADKDGWEKMKHQKTLELGEPVQEDDEDGIPNGKLSKSTTLDYTQLAKKVGGFKVSNRLSNIF